MKRQANPESTTMPTAQYVSVQLQKSISGNSHHPSIAAQRGPMKLIPWDDIWISLHAAKIRGHGEMIEVFYETLFKEAVFDDDGAWSQAPANRN